MGQMAAYFFLQVSGQNVGFIEEGDITFPPEGETVKSREDV